MVKEIAARPSNLLPNNITALNSKAVSLLNLGRNNESLVYLTKALAIDPNNIHALINKAVVFLI